MQTLSKIILEPLNHIGPAFSSLIKGVFQGLPIQLYPIALVCFMVFFVIILIVGSGYDINLFHLICLRAPRQQPVIGYEQYQLPGRVPQRFIQQVRINLHIPQSIIYYPPQDHSPLYSRSEQIYTYFFTLSTTPYPRPIHRCT